MATTTTTHQVIDPRGDILLCFPGRQQQQQHQHGLDLPTTAHPSDHHHPKTDPSSPETVCNELSRQQGHNLIPLDNNITNGSSSNNGNSNSNSNSSGTLYLQVSSSVLCLASPVFAAMLSGPMAEGVAFRAADSPRPFPLTLPEDDGAIFCILANVLHFRPESVPALPPTATLLALASLVDKYDCAAALLCYGEIWLNRAIERHDDAEYGSFTQRCELLLFAYVLDLPVPFAQLSWDVILHHRQQLKGETEFGLDLAVPEDHELLRHDLHGEIAKRKARLRREVYNALMEPITRVTAHLTFISSDPHTLEARPTCPNAALAMGNYMAFLDAHNLSPWRPQYETDSFASIMTRALEAALQARDNPMLKFEMCSRSRCRCSGMAYGDGVHMAQKLAWMFGGAMKWKLWACLDCLKKGSDTQGNCRVKHW